MKIRFTLIPLFLAVCTMAAAGNIGKVTIGGYVGGRIEACIAGRVMAQDVEEIVAPFRSKEDSSSWQTEFAGKWLLGAVGMYTYSPSPELLDKIGYVAEGLIQTQLEDGYIGNYSPEARLTGWDIWGRKYTALSLLSWYRLTGDAKVLEAVKKSIDCLVRDLDERGLDIARTGNYFGMASCSVLEPVVYLYRETGERKYLDFAERIASAIEKEGSSMLVSKALAGVPVSERSPRPSRWWSFENGMKAYEMMSCYEGLVELGRETGNALYIEAARRTIENIIADEINIAGSGAAFECWYKGRHNQTRPAYHTMETCVTFTWMQFCARMLSGTHDSRYADQFERTMYNALMASMKADGNEISKYSPLEGHRFAGEHQCGLHINCCNANGPRGFALIPTVAYDLDGSDLYVNLYLPSEAEFMIGKTRTVVRTSTLYPVKGETLIDVSPDKPSVFTVALRIPEYAGTFDVRVNGEKPAVDVRNGFMRIERKWKAGDRISLDMDIATRVVRQDNFQAVVHGPVVFARDSRLGSGDIDESCVIQCSADGTVEAVISDVQGKSFSWLEMEVPAVLGANLEDETDREVKPVKFCDFASAGNDWDRNGRYRVWIPQTLNVMTETYHAY